MDIKNWFEDVVPLRRKRAADWILPMCAGLGLGVLAGVGVGLLVAPATGEEARLRLREGAYRVKDRARSLAARAKHEIVSTDEPLHLGRS